MEMAVKQSSPFMELFRQLCLTPWATVSYCLWKWLARSFPIYGNGFRSCTSENQWLHTELGNFRTEKPSLKQELVELRAQLETERADWEEIETKLSEKKQNFALTVTRFEKLTPDAATILSQLRVRVKKSKTDLADLEAILEILKS